jgi:hypothetical protein
MLKFRSWLLALIVLALAGLACEETESIPQEDSIQSPLPAPVDPEPKGKRVLELDANSPEDGNYDRVMDMARELGAESIRLSIYWDKFETAPGVYNPDPNWLAIANQYYSAQNLKISLTISVLDTTEIRLPLDLQGRSFSDPELIERFYGFLDYVSTQLTDVDLVYLAIGNEIDGVLGSNAQNWQDFSVFYQATATYASQIWPDLPISTKVTFDGFFNQASSYSKEIYQGSDSVMTTYYPLNGDFSVKDPSVVLVDLQTLVELFPDKQILITEIGYPTSPENNSSEAKQAEFIHHMFQAWDANAGQISLISYSWLSDLPQSTVSELETYYRLKEKGFAEFLRTLGLRTYPASGKDKIGYEVFRVEAESRGW